MIVTCNNCKSAFTVNDEKVQGKKFAFNCPKCSHNNIINMSSESVLPKPVGAMASAAISRKASDVSDDSFFDFDEEPKNGEEALSFDSTEEQRGDNGNGLDFSDSDTPAENEFEDFEYEEEIEPEIDLSLLSGGSNSPDEDEFTDELADEAGDVDLDSLEIPSFDDENTIPEMESGDETDAFDVGDFSAASFETPSGKSGESSFQDDLSIDLDALDIPLEEPSSIAKASPEIAEEEDDEIIFDIDAFDEPPAPKAATAAVKTTLPSANSAAKTTPQPKSTQTRSYIDDAATDLDLDLLDLDLAESEIDNALAEVETADDALDFGSLDLELDDDEMNVMPKEETDSEDDALSIDLDSLNIDLDESEAEELAQETGTVSSELQLPDLVELTTDELSEVATLQEDEALSIDLDSLDLNLDESEQTASPADESEDEALSIDLDLLDLDLDESEQTASPADEGEDETLSIDLDSLDLDLDDAAGSVDTVDTIGGEEDDEALSIDLDSLDLDLEQNRMQNKIDEDQEDEKLSIDLDSLDIDLDDELAAPPVSASEDEDERLSIDLDSLDVELEDEDNEILPAGMAAAGALESDLPFDLDDSDFDDTAPIVLADDEIPEELNTDDLALDIDPRELGILPPLEETAAKSSKAGTRISRIADVVTGGTDEDDAISIDLDDLDTEILESAEVTDGLSSDFLDIDELDDDSFPVVDEDETIFDDDSIQIADLDDEPEEYAPAKVRPYESLTHRGAAKALPAEVPLSDVALDTMPEVDLERMYEEEERALASRAAKDDLLDLDTPEIEDEQEKAVAGAGYINFSVDYTLKYSRLRALAKLSGLYLITLIPHFFVLLLYSVVASICSFFNNIIALCNGETEGDFTRFQEKTLRYSTGILANILNVMEERPPYAGEESVDTTVQMQAYPPIKFSRFLSLMRLSVVGILLLTLPHLLILAILSVALVPFTIIGLISTVIAAAWPSFLLDYTIRYLRYLVNVSAFITGIVDAYPSFRFD